MTFLGLSPKAREILAGEGQLSQEPTSWILEYLSELELVPSAVEIEIATSSVWPSALKG